MACFRRRLVLVVPVLPVFVIIQRIFFISQGWFDIETPVIVAGLSHPWLNVWEAPYGGVWYAANVPLTWVKVPGWNLEQSWLLWTSIIDLFFSLLLLRVKPRLVLPYLLVSIVTWRQAPYNLSIYWLTGLGLYNSWLLVLAILAKTPVGAPLTVWQFILNSPPLASEWRYYGLMMAWWLLILAQTRRIQEALEWLRVVWLAWRTRQIRQRPRPF